MKNCIHRFLYVCAACCLAGSTAAQPSAPRTLPQWQPDTVFLFGNNGQCNERRTYAYNGKAQRVTEYSAVPDGTQWTDKAIRTYTYDAYGNLLKNELKHKSEKEWVTETEISYTYDAEQRLIEMQEQHWNDSSRKWQNDHHFFYTYNARGKCDTIVHCDLGDEYSGRTFYSFDEAGRQLTEHWQLWDSVGKRWEDSYRSTRTYDSNGNELTFLSENWNHTHGGPPKLEWENYEHVVCTYDSLNRLTDYFFETWLCPEQRWEYLQHSTYTYDDNGNMITDYRMDWKRGKNAHWINSEYRTYVYDEQNRLIQCIFQTGMSDSLWRPNTTTTYSYDENGHQIYKMEELWKNSEWLKFSLYAQDFDSEGNLLKDAYFNWDNTQNDWKGTYRYLYHFDSLYNGDTASYELYDPKKGWCLSDNNISVSYDLQRQQIGIFNTSRAVVRYTLLTDESVIDRKQTRLQCYPNPCYDELHVDAMGGVILRYVITDATGRVRMEGSSDQTKLTIFLHSLPSGYYILHCSTTLGNAVSTFVKYR